MKASSSSEISTSSSSSSSFIILLPGPTPADGRVTGTFLLGATGSEVGISSIPSSISSSSAIIFSAGIVPLRDCEDAEVSFLEPPAALAEGGISVLFTRAGPRSCAVLFIGFGSISLEPGRNVAMFGFIDLAPASGAESFDSFIRTAFATSVSDLPILDYSF